MAKLDILIPTYNRSVDLVKNLNLLDRLITNELGEDLVRIVVSDNCSTDDTSEQVMIFQKKSKINFLYHRNEKNIGLEPNVVKVLELATADHVMFIGDDDFIDEGYLVFVFESLKRNPNLGVIISGIQNLTVDQKTDPGRLEAFQVKELPAGYQSAIYASHLGHQLSGLVLKRDGLLDHYLQFTQWRNPYLFIHFVTFCLLRHGGIYAPKFKTSVTVFNEKDWSYNKVGLLDEVFKSYYPFRVSLSDQEVRDFLLRFSVVHSYRYDVRISQPFRLIKQFFFLIKTTPKLPKFRRKLGVQLLKEYLLTVMYVK